MLNSWRLMGLVAVFVGSASVLQSLAAEVDVAPSRHFIGAKAPKAYVPYVASHPLAEPSRRVTRIVFSIHSSGFNALQYFENARIAASQVRGALSESLIIAPQLFEQSAIPNPVPDGLLFWRVSPFRGSSRGGIGPEAEKVSISAFEVIDDWLVALTDPDLFPRLQNVVLVGHSGGGQFVQRYAMIGKFEPPANVKIRYVVSAPSSYAYPSAERYDQRSNRFVVPDDAVVAQCPEYNDWGYGLGKPYAYFSDVDTKAIAERYQKRSVFYLCGSNDNDPNDDTIGRSRGAMMQGRHRLERMQVFAAYLENKYGRSIQRTHRFAVVPGVGHFGKGTMNSSQGLMALFAPIR